MARNTRSRPRGGDPDDPPPSEEGAILFDEFQDADVDGDGRLSPEEAINQYVANYDIEGLVDYLNAPHGEWGASQRREVESALADLQETNPEFYSVFNSYAAPDTPADEATDAVGTPTGSMQSAVEAEELATAQQQAREDALGPAADYYAGLQADYGEPTGRVDDAGLVDYLPEGMTPGSPEAEAFLEEARDLGMEQWREEQERGPALAGATEEERGALLDAEQQRREGILGATEPDWLLQMNAGELSQQQKDRYVDYWNDAYGTSLRDFDRDLAPILARYDGTETEVQNFANAVLADQEPLIQHAIELPFASGTRKATYSEEQLADLRAMGYSNAAITRLVRLAAFADGPDSFDGGQDFASANLRAFAALTRYYGGGDEFGQFDHSTDEVNQLQMQIGMDWRSMSAKERREARAELEARAKGGRNAGASAAAADLAAMDRIDALFRGEANIENRGRTPGILAARNNFNRGLEQYRGDEYFALIYAVDPNLAQRLEATGGDPDDLDWQDNAAIYDILEQGGVLTSEGVRLRQSESSVDLFGYFSQGGRGGGGGGAGPVRREVDPAAVKDQVQQLWSRLFLADVDDATVAAITANLQAQLDAAPDGMSFDATARIRAFLEGQDVYDELYRNKPEGLSEEEYQGQFAQGISDMIGAELDPEAMKSGMRTGDYQASVGRAASSDKLLTNSTLRGRWAQAKQTLDRFS